MSNMFNQDKVGKLYILEKPMPQMEAGVIFELREHEDEGDIGSAGCGYMTNIWVNGNTQSGWAERTHILPGQLADDREWFTPVKMLNSSNDIFAVNGVRFRKIKE